MIDHHKDVPLKPLSDDQRFKGSKANPYTNRYFKASSAYNPVVEEVFRSAMTQANIIYTGEIIADGLLHRFHIEGDRPRSQNGWYVLHRNGIPSGAFGSWKTGDSSKWSLKSNNLMLPSELAEHHRRLVDAQHQRNHAKLQQQRLAAKRAQHIWDISGPADPSHSYLLKKHVDGLGLRQLNSLLITPLRDISGALHNLQFVTEDGNKRFLCGGRITGTFFSLGMLPSSGSLYICEGWATAKSIRKVTNCPVVAAMTANNLKATALALRNNLPHTITLVIAADNDRYTDGNPGIAKGKEAAETVGAKLALPHFLCDGCNCTDFNDLYNCEISDKEITNDYQ